MIALAKFFDWRDALVIVETASFVKWHRTAFKMLCPMEGLQARPCGLRTNLLPLLRNGRVRWYKSPAI